VIRLEAGDCVEIIPRLVDEGVQVDAVVTDPPYDLLQASRNGSRRLNDGPGPFGRHVKGGFMNHSWDATGIAFRPKTWATIATVLRPGGFMLAFGGTRTSHRMVSAIEDAGFVIQDTIMWLYGQGFPKGRTSLKPAFEPICVAYKRGGERTLQIDECRVPTSDGRLGWDGSLRRKPMEGDTRTGAALGMFNPNGRDGEESANRRYTNKGGTNFAVLPGPRGGEASGRWPANVIHDGSEEVMETFEEFGEKPASYPGRQDLADAYAGAELPPNGILNFGSNNRAGRSLSVTGTAARFFYCAKAVDVDRWGSRHPTVKPVELMKWLVKLVTPPGGTCLDSFAGSGTTGVAALATGRNAILIEREPQYQADIRERLAYYEGEGRHSLAAKNRASAERGLLPLFDL
jgi:site-specific DNA-methyltransferase (adenine-specific)